MLGAGDGPSLKTICRAQWLQWGAIAAFVYFTRGVSELNNERSETEFVHHAMVTLAVTIMALFAAAAQFEDRASQRKVLQYAIIGYTIILLADLRLDNFDPNKAYERLPIYAFLLLNLMALVASVYLWHYDDHFIDASESKLPIVARVAAGICFVRSCFCLWWSTGTNQMPPLGRENELLLTIPAALLGMVSLILIAASFCDENAVRKTLQYSLVLPIMSFWPRVHLYMIDPRFITRFMMFMSVLEPLGCVYFLYQANIRKTLLRLAYAFCFLYAYLGIYHPKVLHHSGVVRTGNVEAAELIGASWGLVGALFAAAGQFGDDDQRKVLQYSMIAALLIASHSAYKHEYYDPTLWTFAALSSATLYGSCCMKLCTGGRSEEEIKKGKGKAVSPGKMKRKHN